MFETCSPRFQDVPTIEMDVESKDLVTILEQVIVFEPIHPKPLELITASSTSIPVEGIMLFDPIQF